LKIYNKLIIKIIILDALSIYTQVFIVTHTLSCVIFVIVTSSMDGTVYAQEMLILYQNQFVTEYYFLVQIHHTFNKLQQLVN